MGILYLIRHGQSEGNIRGGFAGRIDYPLSPLGQKQANMTADFLRDEHIDVVLSSPLSRAYDTAVPIARTRGLDVLQREDLSEMDFGDWEGLPIEEVARRFPDAIDIWNHEMYKTVCPGGETVRECFARAQRAICAIAETYADKTVCAVSHGALLRGMLCFLHGWPVEDIQKVMWANNASVTKLMYTNGAFQIEYEGYSDHMGAYVTGVSSKLRE